MVRTSPTFGLIVTRLAVVVMMALLALGARAQAVVVSRLSVAPATAATQGPIHEEEEEPRHEAKAKAAAPHKRGRDGPVPPAQVGTLPDHSRTVGHRTYAPARVLPDHEIDFCNGLGAPLRC